jgi:hypothetical protein
MKYKLLEIFHSDSHQKESGLLKVAGERALEAQNKRSFVGVKK